MVDVSVGLNECPRYMTWLVKEVPLRHGRTAHSDLLYLPCEVEL